MADGIKVKGLAQCTSEADVQAILDRAAAKLAEIQEKEAERLEGQARDIGMLILLVYPGMTADSMLDLAAANIAGGDCLLLPPTTADRVQPQLDAREKKRAAAAKRRETAAKRRAEKAEKKAAEEQAAVAGGVDNGHQAGDGLGDYVQA